MCRWRFQTFIVSRLVRSQIIFLVVVGIGVLLHKFFLNVSQYMTSDLIFAGLEIAAVAFCQTSFLRN